MRHKLLTIAAAAGMLAMSEAAAQTATMHLRPESQVILSGSSNIHDWSCRSDAFHAAIEVNPAFGITAFGELEQPVTRVSVNVPVLSIKCGKSKMDENLRKALNEPEFPAITYVLKTFTRTGGTDTELTGTATGDLIVAGRTTTIDIPITATRLPDGGARGEGVVAFRMTDFGVKPPVALLGTLRTKDEVKVTFTVTLEKAVVVALESR